METSQISRVMGGIWIITSTLWVIFAVLGLIYGINWLNNTQTKLDENLGLLVDSLDSVENPVIESVSVISTTHQSLETIGQALDDTSATLTDMRPLIWKTTKLVTEDVPNALDGVQGSMPSLVATAKSVDETLTWLSNFGFTIPNPFGADWSYDLGISYAPEVPLDQAMETMSGNLEEVPDDMRAMEEDLDNMDANLLIIRDDLSLLSGNIDAVNSHIAGINPRLIILSESISEIETSFTEMQSALPESFDKAKNILIGVIGVLLLTQVPSFYMGWLLVSGTLFSVTAFGRRM